MLYRICLVIAVFVLSTSPSRVAAQATELVVSHERLQLALVPEHLKKRMPSNRERAAPDPNAPPEPELNPYEKKVRNAKIGIGVSSVGLLVGGLIAGLAAMDPSGFLSFDSNPSQSDSSGKDAAIYAGSAIAAASAASMIATGALLGVRKRELRRYEKREKVATAHAVRYLPPLQLRW